MEYTQRAVRGIVQSITRKRDGLKIDNVYYNCFPSDSRIREVGFGDLVEIVYEEQPKKIG